MSNGVLNRALDYLADCTHIVDAGTSNGWNYYKYSDGKYHAWYEGTINLVSSSSWGGGLYFHNSNTLPIMSFSQSVTSVVAASNGGQLNAYVANAINADNIVVAFANTSSAASLPNIPVRVDVYGTW